MPFLLLFALLLAGCVSTAPAAGGTGSALPGQAQAGSGAAGQSKPAGQSAPPEQGDAVAGTPAAPDIQTREAALDRSGKSAPALPTGVVTSPGPAGSPIQAAASPRPGGSVPAGQGVLHPPNQAQSTPGSIPPTVSPQQEQTREAALNRSAKPVQPGSPLRCAGQVGIMMGGVVLLVWKRRGMMTGR